MGVVTSTLYKGYWLTPMQIKVWGLIAEGLTNKQICDRLVLTYNTIRAHVYALYERLGLHDDEPATRGRAIALFYQADQPGGARVV